jgi:GT2 family glycosyltransferase
MNNNWKAAIIIVNRDGRRFLEDCLNAVFNQTYTNFDVYFVDNWSNDDSLKFVESKNYNIKITKLSKNMWFAAGYNIWIKKALEDKSIDYIVCLNNDTIVDKNWLTAMIIEVNASKKIEMISNMSLFTDGSIQTIWLKFEKNLVWSGVWWLSLWFWEDPDKYKEPFEVYCPSWVSPLFTRRLLEDIWLFDEDFFAYSEDLDLWIRARNKWYICVFTPYSKLIHLHSQSSWGRANPFKAFYNKRNNFFVAIKNFPIIDLLLFPIRDVVWNIKSFMNKDKNKSVNILKNRIWVFAIIWIMIRVYLSVLWYFPKMLYKRFKSKKF